MPLKSGELWYSPELEIQSTEMFLCNGRYMAFTSNPLLPVYMFRHEEISEGGK